eukprot:gb/GECG01004394.1/.p1 GENE.gb/GECG01004394.1/~~gb/GECG01004394.1/.p1  ORF type:complete len:643 (+),score=51.66 gb/GECG01004394.1/:1-1929(+)
MLQPWSDAVWATKGPEALPILRFQLPTSAATSTASSSSSPSSTHTPTATTTQTGSAVSKSSQSPVPTETPSLAITPTGSATGRATRTKANIPTTTLSRSSLRTMTPTATGDHSYSPTETSIRVEVPTSTSTVIETTTCSRTPTHTPSETSTRTDTTTVLWTSTSTPSNTPTSTRLPNGIWSAPSRMPTTSFSSATSCASSVLTTIRRTPQSTGSSSFSPVQSRYTMSPTARVKWSPTFSATQSSAHSPIIPNSATTVPTPPGDLKGAPPTTIDSSSTPLNGNESDAVSSRAMRNTPDVLSFALRTLLPSVVGALLLIVTVYLAYRRKQNETAVKVCSDPRSMYATQLGIPLESLKLLSNLNSSSDAISHASIASSGQLTPGQMEKFPMGASWNPETSEILSKDTFGSRGMVHLNPLASNARLAGQLKCNAQKHDVLDKFLLKSKKIGRIDIIPCTLSRVHSEPGSTHMSVNTTVERGSQEMPGIILVDTRSYVSTPSKPIRIVSVEAPSLVHVRKNRSGNAVMQVAVAAHLDTVQLKRIDRIRLKLRHWKAKLLAEPPPLVQIETEFGGDSDTLDKYEQSPLFKHKLRSLDSLSADFESHGLALEKKEHHHIVQMRGEEDPPKKKFAPRAPRIRRTTSNLPR